MNSKSPNTELILASSSPYRKMLLQRLGLPFNTVASHLDESALPGESAADLTRRLAKGKARSIAEQKPGALVIGCDQAAEFEETIIGKPATAAAAVAQLLKYSGKSVLFHSAICVLRQQPWFFEESTIPTWVHFRVFDRAEAERYVELDQPLDCSGSFKSEAAGSVLLNGLESVDPTALIGLPLIALSQILRTAGFRLP
jgi:septum formation protein